MKKKGLIISTIVMVIVLIASLTTATYAWFSATNATTIDGFDVSVVPGNTLKIGLRATSTGYDAGASETDFVTGDLVYAGNSTAGKIYGGTWIGNGATATPGLGATLTHNIKWGAQDMAVGYDGTATTVAGATNATMVARTDDFSDDETAGFFIKANSNDADTAIGTPEAAVANTDYVYFDLGVAPTKDLSAKPSLYIIAETEEKYLGIGASIHVAYRVNGGEWDDACIYGNDAYTTEIATRTAPTKPSDVDDAALTTAGISPTFDAGMGMVTIPLTATKVNGLDQVEVIIYIAGADTDCITKAVSNGTFKIALVFGAIAQN